MKLTQIDKNKLYEALERNTNARLKELSLRIFDHQTEGVLEELVDIQEDVKLLDKLEKDKWDEWGKR